MPANLLPSTMKAGLPFEGAGVRGETLAHADAHEVSNARIASTNVEIPARHQNTNPIPLVAHPSQTFSWFMCSGCTVCWQRGHHRYRETRFAPQTLLCG
jgi:hypothetical protein